MCSRPNPSKNQEEDKAINEAYELGYSEGTECGEKGVEVLYEQIKELKAKAERLDAMLLERSHELAQVMLIIHRRVQIDKERAEQEEPVETEPHWSDKY